MDIPLTEDGELQVQAYLRFAKLKRDQHVREVASTIRDFKADRVRPGDIYNYKDVSAMLEDLEDTVHTLADKEIQNAYHANALLVKLLLSQAQAQSLDLQVDTTSLENEFLLKTISSSEAIALGRPASDFVRRGGALGKLGVVASVAVQDPALVEECNELRSKLADMQQRLKQVQEETTGMMRERSAQNSQVQKLKSEVAERDAQLIALRHDITGAASKLQLHDSPVQMPSQEVGRLQMELQHAREELAERNTMISKRDKELSALNEALNGKLQDSKQWQQMKTLMQAKSAEVVALRKRLSAYEPQAVPSAD